MTRGSQRHYIEIASFVCRRRFFSFFSISLFLSFFLSLSFSRSLPVPAQRGCVKLRKHNGYSVVVAAGASLCK